MDRGMGGAGVKIGLIARCEYARGLAIQSKNFYDHMPVERVLLVRYPSHLLDCPERPEWYPGHFPIEYDSRFHQLNETLVRQFLEGLDVVFSVETPYDWRLPNWAREMGVKTVIQGNPEFYRNDQPEYAHQAEPDAWWWPTPWRLDRLPRGQVMPVPMPDVPATAASDGPIRFLHVVGKRAYMDRNGTDIVIDALRAITEPCDVTISGFGWDLPEIALPIGSPVRLVVEREGVQNRWQMYADQHILLLPRRYGGLSLPALEAAVSGVAVVMPDVSPNEVLAARFLPARNDRYCQLAAGKIPMADVSHRDLGDFINRAAADPDDVRRMQERSLQMVPRWSEMRAAYIEEFERVCAG